MEETYKLYDSINTMAVRWLTYNTEKGNKKIGIKNFKKNNIYHMWFLHMMENYSIFNNYCNYYIDGNIFIFLYLRFIKKIKHIHYKLFQRNIKMIDVRIFIDELCLSFNQDSKIIEEIYKSYWGENG